MNYLSKTLIMIAGFLNLAMVSVTYAADSDIIIVKAKKDTATLLKLQAVPSEKGKPFTKGIKYEVYKIKADGKREKNATESKYNVGGVVFKGIKPGKYFIVAMLKDAKKIRTSITIDLKSGQKSYYIFDLNVGVLKVNINTATSNIMEHIYYEVDTDNLAQDRPKNIYNLTNNYFSNIRHMTGRKPKLPISPINGDRTFYLRPGKYTLVVGEYFRGNHKWMPIKKKKIAIKLGQITQHTFNLNNKK